MKRIVKKVISELLYFSGISPVALSRKMRSKRNVFVFLYHRIADPKDSFEAAVNPQRFEEHLRYFRRHFETVSVGEARRRAAGSFQGKKPLAVITFDDGYRDNYVNAYPLLRQYGLPATFFLATGSLEGGEPMWTSRVDALFKHTSRGELVLESAEPPQTFRFGPGEDRMRACFAVKRVMKRVPDSERERMILEISEKLGEGVPVDLEIDSEMLSWDEVRAMAEDPLIEFGSHTVSHRMLANLNRDQILKELMDSKEQIEGEIGGAVRYLSYPGNSYHEEVCALARDAGYKAAFAVDQTTADFTQDAFRLPRLHVENGSVRGLVGEISGAMSAVRSWTERWRKPMYEDKTHGT